MSSIVYHKVGIDNQNEKGNKQHEEEESMCYRSLK